MKFSFKILNAFFLTWFIILLIRWEPLLNIYKMIYRWFILFIVDSENALKQINSEFMDYAASGILFVVLPVLIFLYRKKAGFISSAVSPSTIFIILLIFCFLFAPVISNQNPDFYKNTGMTRLLPPFSSVKVLHLISTESKENKTELEKFLIAKNYAVKQPFDQSIEYIDSISHGGKIVYYYHGEAKEISEKNLVLKDGLPFITTRLFLTGTDQFGRDLLTRLIYGARISLLVGLGSVAVSLIIGSLLGFIAGYTGGIPDTILSRITDMFLSFPVIFLVVLVLALFGNSLISVIVVLGFSGWMSLFKIVRTEVLSIKNKNYFISSGLLGLSKRQLFFNEVLPVIIIPVIVNVIFQFGNVIIAESALSYLGMGPGANYPSWGSMIQSGQEYLSSAWWMILLPGFAIIFTLLSANNFGILLKRKLNPLLSND